MKKVILAILMAATKESLRCAIMLNMNGNIFETKGSIKLLENPQGDEFKLEVWRGGESSSMTLTPDDHDLTVGTIDHKYEISVGGACITFLDEFQRDPFTVQVNG